MYEVDRKDRVVELTDLPPSSPGAPLPVVVADEHRLFVAYIVDEPDPNWDGRSVTVVTPESADETIALIQFVRYSAHFFGPPNDEAFAGHPLASRGLHPYGAFEVEQSSWLRLLERRNRVHPYHSAASFADLRHFVLAFHDSTFECIARGYEIHLQRSSISGVMQSMLGKLR